MGNPDFKNGLSKGRMAIYADAMFEPLVFAAGILISLYIVLESSGADFSQVFNIVPALDRSGALSDALAVLLPVCIAAPLLFIISLIRNDLEFKSDEDRRVILAVVFSVVVAIAIFGAICGIYLGDLLDSCAYNEELTFTLNEKPGGIGEFAILCKEIADGFGVKLTRVFYCSMILVFAFSFIISLIQSYSREIKKNTK